MDLRWPNAVEQNNCFYVIDASEFAQYHGKAIYSNMLRIFDPATADSCKPTTKAPNESSQLELKLDFSSSSQEMTSSNYRVKLNLITQNLNFLD